MLLVRHNNGTTTEEEARTEVRRMIRRSKREELRTLVQEKQSLIPKVIIESFFKLYKIFYYLYDSSDEYRIPGRTFDEMNALLYEPLLVPPP